MRLHRTSANGPASLERRGWIVAVLLLLPATHAAANIFTVGAPGAGCSHETIAAAVVAAEANPAGDTIRITRTQAYPSQQIEITTAQDLSIVGGFATCASTVSDGVKTVLSGAGGVSAPVLLLRGNGDSRIRLRLLRLTGGDSTVAGGGINYVGSGELELIEIGIDGNAAPNGGGIYFAGNAGGAALTISNDNLISGNQATAGGGIYLVNGGMTMNAPGSSIAFNIAQVGGGLYVYGAEGRTAAVVGSGGFPGIATIYANEAAVGGGVAVHAPNVGGITDASFTLRTFDPAAPASISNNFASQRGGGIDLQPYEGLNAVGQVDARVFSARLEANIAPVGAAVYAGNDANGLGIVDGSLFQIDSGRISGHLSQTGDSAPTDGATIVATEETQVSIARTRIEGNTAGRIVRAGGAKRVEILSSLITANTVQDTVLSIDGTGLLGFEIDGTTIAGNSIGADVVIYARGQTSLGNSILWQPGRITLDADNAVVDDVLASEIASLGDSETIVSAPPRFIDPLRGEYRLQAASPAVDFSGATGLSAIDGIGRGIDLERVANFNGPSDLGAFERPELGNLALNPGFVDDLRLWQSGIPGSMATWTGSGPSNGGSVTLGMTSAPGGNFVGLRQCIRIPGPGFYRLTGLGYGSGVDALTRDDVSMRWLLRNDSGGEECVGAIDAEGVVDFGSGATWQQPIAPGLIDVGAALWTRYTNVEVLLQVREGSFNINATTTGFFDEIRLEAVDGVAAPLFADGFEP
jgi:hypothetical protein